MKEEELKVIGALLVIAGMIMIISGAIVYGLTRTPEAEGITWALIGSGLAIIWSTWTFWRWGIPPRKK